MSNVVPLVIKRLLPASDLSRRETLKAYRDGDISRVFAIDQLIRHCGMDPVSAAREVADAIQF